MSKVIFRAALVLTIIVSTGCVTRKIPVEPGAEKVHAISAVAQQGMSCEKVDTFKFEDGHPNNFYQYIKNTTYMLGGTHFQIEDVIKTRKGRPVGAQVSAYHCQSVASSANRG
ncbi:hypothetical protein [Vibrio nomapromontoriensis]|uniref:hypothetical protein n=1 Tax=Vibrio nomapromontoriensis TaxID=2910246 RepID=UPI003D102BAF